MNCMWVCGRCGTRNESDFAYCTGCGKKRNSHKKKSKHMTVLFVAIFILLTSAGAFYVLSIVQNKNKENTTVRTDINVSIGQVGEMSENQGGSEPKIYYSDTGKVLKEEYYAPSGYIEAEKRYNTLGVLYYFWQGEFDESGKKLRDNWYDSNGDLGLYAEHTYDDRGNAVRATFFYPSGAIDCWCQREYDETGNEIRTWYSPEGEVYIINEHDTKGNLVKENIDPLHLTYPSVVYEYDEAGNNIRETHYWSNGGIPQLIENEYDSVGNKMCTVTWSYDPWNTMREERYDTRGNKIYDMYLDLKQDKELYHMEWEYDLDGFLAKIRVYFFTDSEEVVIEGECEYDSEGGKVVLEGYLNGEFSTIVYKYDLAGNKISEITYNFGGEIQGAWFEYQFDAAGHLTEMISHQPDGTDDGIIGFDVAGNQTWSMYTESDGKVTSVKNFVRNIV